jgi:signal transduction histidine kinase
LKPFAASPRYLTFCLPDVQISRHLIFYCATFSGAYNKPPNPRLSGVRRQFLAANMLSNDSDAGDKPAEHVSVADVLENCLSCGILVIDARGHVGSLNGRAEQLLGIDRPQVLDHPFSVLPQQLAEFIKRFLSQDTRNSEQHIEISTSGEIRSLMRVTALASDSKTGSPGQVILILNDISRAKELEHAMHRVDRLATIGTLSAGLAHEIKNAMVAGRTFVELLLEKQLDTELATVVRREMQRIDSLLSQLLRFASPAKPNFGPLRVHEVLDHSLRLIHPQSLAQKMNLRRNFQAGTDLVHGDSFQLQQAFMNLFLNAIEAMGTAGTLEVITSLAEDGASTSLKDSTVPARLCIAVHDTGPGIAPENLGRLFEPFFTTKPHGTGLGLPITRRIIQEHGGELKVENGSDRGATFKVFLPLRPAMSFSSSAGKGFAAAA